MFSVQGMDTEEGKIRLISDVIQTSLNIEMSVLMGANIAKDVAQGDFCECTIGRESECECESERERANCVKHQSHVRYIILTGMPAQHSTHNPCDQHATC